MTVAAYSTTPGLNITINGVSVAPGMPRNNVDDAIRNLMADIKSWTVTYGLSNPVTIAQGGTGASTASTGFTALAASGGTMGASLTRSGGGVYPYYSSSSMSGGKIFVQAVGSDPMANPGDIVFEY